MISDALSDGVADLDHYLTDPYWRSDYGARTLARADAIRAAMGALRFYLDVVPSTAGALDAALAGYTQVLEDKIAQMVQEWRAQKQPNLHFSPTEFRATAYAAIKVLQVLDAHLVPLLPELKPLAPKPRDGS